MVPYLIAGLALLATGCAQTFWRKKEPLPQQPIYPIDRDRMGRESDASRVRALEGLRLSDFEHALPYLPGRQEVLGRLNAIITGKDWDFRGNTGDATRIDPLWETLRAARLFLSDPKPREIPYPHLWPFGLTEKDLDAYREETLIQYWDRNRNRVKEEFQLARVNHPFVALLDKLPVLALPTLRGLPSYDRLAQAIPNLLHNLRQSKNLTVLYPGSGFHIAPLLTALRLIDNKEMEGATFIYTEIDANNFAWLVDVLQLGLGDVFDHITVEKKVKFPGEDSEQTIVLGYKGHPIRILFALNRSGKEYYRPEYLREADLIVIHDPGNGAFQDSFNLAARIIWDKRLLVAEKPQVLIMEGTRKGHPNDQFGFPDNMPQVLLPGPYGHCGGALSVAEIEFCDFDSARAFPLHDPALLSLAATQASPVELSHTLYPPGQETIIFRAQ